jgi:putative tricarboxylic transport membrane protein
VTSRPRAGRDLASGVGLAAFAALYLVANRRYPLDSVAAPGHGGFPLAVGFILLGLAGWQTCRALPAWLEVRRTGAEEGDGVSSPGHPLLMIGLVVAYAAAIGAIGFLSASFALVLASSRLLEARGWLRPVALALGVTAVAYLIFVAWLGVPLPAGLLR